MLLLGQMLLVFSRLAVRFSTVRPLYTLPRLNAACFGALSVGVLGDHILCYLPTLHLSEMLPVLVR